MAPAVCLVPLPLTPASTYALPPCLLMQTCKTMRQLADTPWVWKAQAERKWGALAAPHLGGYSSHKALLLDDCRRSAVLSLPFPAQSACSYTRQRPDYFFRCKLLQLEWLRCDNSLRCGPSYGSLAVVVSCQPVAFVLVLVSTAADSMPAQHASPCQPCRLHLADAGPADCVVVHALLLAFSLLPSAKPAAAAHCGHVLLHAAAGCGLMRGARPTCGTPCPPA